MCKSLYTRLLITIITASLLLLPGCLANPEAADLNTEPPESYRKAEPPIVAAYLHIGNRVLDVRNLDLEGIDIVNLAFSVIKNNHIGLLYPTDAKNFHVARQLKRKYPGIKVFVSVGGQGTEKMFSQMSASEQGRKVFVDDAVRFVRSYGLDGIDVDWEYPGMKKATRTADRTNFTLLLADLRAAFDDASRKDGKKYYVTVASGAFEQYLNYIEPLKVTPSVDYFFVMTYDFHGQWNEYNGHHTNIFTPSGKKWGGHSVARIVDLYASKGIPRNKIVIGAAFYGRKWTGVDLTAKSIVYNPGKGVGSVSYRNIVSLLKPGTGYQRYWDRQAYAPFIYNKAQKIFISYDDKESVARKVDYACMNRLGGVMYWEHFSDANHNELSKAIVDEMSLRKGCHARLRFPGGYIAKKCEK
ncbi:MAG: glycoside hydrolase family 18 protein [Bacteroidales bacterium]|nr:glycoside hydrolase family 18 protein [Bacteroidales bacterium]